MFSEVPPTVLFPVTFVQTEKIEQTDCDCSNRSWNRLVLTRQIGSIYQICLSADLQPVLWSLAGLRLRFASG